jgi:hypothetical protein
MEYVEYELGTLLEFAQQPLTEAQVKGLMQQVRGASESGCERRERPTVVVSGRVSFRPA